MVRKFRVSDDLTREALLHNQALLGEKRIEFGKQRIDLEDSRLIAIAQQRSHQEKYDETEVMLRKARERPGSNIPPRFQDFRAELAAQLALSESALPFLAELVEVKPGQSSWRGAIERAIGSERLRGLVPQDYLKAALCWVNHRDNQLHVRLQRAGHDEESVAVFSDGYNVKLNFKDHPLIDTAKKLLAGRDLHCVESPEALSTVEHGLTIEGMMSGRHGRFEKQDQRRLNEDWMTGFDNKDQLEVLVRQLRDHREAVDTWQTESEKRRRQTDELDQQLRLIDAVTRLEFAKIDLPGAESDLTISQNRLAVLSDPNSDTAQAKAAHDLEDARLQLPEKRKRF